MPMTWSVVILRIANGALFNSKSISLPQESQDLFPALNDIFSPPFLLPCPLITQKQSKKKALGDSNYEAPKLLQRFSQEKSCFSFLVVVSYKKKKN